MGAIIFPRISPNFIQLSFNILKDFGKSKVAAKNRNDNPIDHNLIGPWFKSGHKPITRKIIEKIIPNFFSEDFLIIC